MRKVILMFLSIIFLFGCKSVNYTYVEIAREKNYKVFFLECKDSVEVIIPFSFKIINKSNNTLELNPIKPKRRVTFFSEQHTLNEKNERVGFLFKKIKVHDTLLVIVFGSKKINKNQLQDMNVKKETLEQYDKTLTNETKESLEFKNTDLYKSIVENIEKDSIFFHFTNRDKNIDFYKVGILEGKTFFTDDKSKK